MHRLFAQPEFDGPVVAGAEYIIVDDHITQGGTVNALRDHIESHGGKVVAVSALTLSQNSSILSPRKETLDELKAKWPDIDRLLADAGIAESARALTESQARYILKFSPVTFRNRAAAQGVARGGSSLAGALGASQAVKVAPPDERELSPENAARRHSVRRSSGVRPEDNLAAMVAAMYLADREVKAKDVDTMLKNLGIRSSTAADFMASAKDIAKYKKSQGNGVSSKPPKTARPKTALFPS